jgi:hypothetical protein
MKYLKLSSNALFILLTLSCGVFAFAQGNDSPPSDLAVELAAPGYPTEVMPVPSVRYRNNLQLPQPANGGAGSSERRAIRIVVCKEGVRVRVEIVALKERFWEDEGKIASLLLVPGEKVFVREMADRGFQPLELTVVALEATPPVLPLTVVKAPSVEVVSVVQRQSKAPGFLLTLRNISSKDINEVEIRRSRSRMGMGIQWAQDFLSRPVLLSGRTLEVFIPTTGFAANGHEDFTPSPPDLLEVAGVVFADKSYEGDLMSAARYLAKLRGHRIQVEHVLEILEETQGMMDQATALGFMEGKTIALSRDAQADQFFEFLTELEFSTMSPDANLNLKTYFETGLHEVRYDMLNEIRRCAMAPNGDFADWLSRTKKKYEEWRSRV